MNFTWFVLCPVLILEIGFRRDRERGEVCFLKKNKIGGLGHSLRSFFPLFPSII
jgi:hypothetical protein